MYYLNVSEQRDLLQRAIRLAEQAESLLQGGNLDHAKATAAVASAWAAAANAAAGVMA